MTVYNSYHKTVNTTKHKGKQLLSSWNCNGRVMKLRILVWALDTSWSTLIRCNVQHTDSKDRTLVRLWTDKRVSHDDVIKWKHFPRHWPFVRRIHRSPVNFPHKGQLVTRSFDVFSLISAWTYGWVNNQDAGDLRRHRAHYDVTVMYGVCSLRDFGNNVRETSIAWVGNSVPAWNVSLWLLWRVRCDWCDGIVGAKLI